MTQLLFNGARIAVLEGGDQAQLNEIRSRLTSAGASVAGVPQEVPFDRAHPSGFAGLIVADAAGADSGAARVVREFMLADKPVAAIGNGVRTLVAADAVAGRYIAGADDIRADVHGAGGEIGRAHV